MKIKRFFLSLALTIFSTPIFSFAANADYRGKDDHDNGAAAMNNRGKITSQSNHNKKITVCRRRNQDYPTQPKLMH